MPWIGGATKKGISQGFGVTNPECLPRTDGLLQPLRVHAHWSTLLYLRPGCEFSICLSQRLGLRTHLYGRIHTLFQHRELWHFSCRIAGFPRSPKDGLLPLDIQRLATGLQGTLEQAPLDGTVMVGLNIPCHCQEQKT